MDTIDDFNSVSGYAYLNWLYCMWMNPTMHSATFSNHQLNWTFILTENKPALQREAGQPEAAAVYAQVVKKKRKQLANDFFHSQYE